MDRSTFFLFAIAAALTVSSCQTPRHAQETEQKTTAPHGVLAPATDAAPTTPPAPAAPPAPATPPTPPASAPAQSSAPSAPAPPPARPAKPSSPNTTAVPKQAAAPPLASAKAPPAAPKSSLLDLNSLEQRLKDTRAIGVFTKLSLKNQVDDLLGEFRAFHKGAAKTAQTELRQKYDLLMMKVLSLLQNGDPQLASAIASSREAIWRVLMDPQQFANI